MFERLFARHSEGVRTDKRAIRRGVLLQLASCATFGEEEYYLDIRCLFEDRYFDDIMIGIKGEHGKQPELFEHSYMGIAAPDQDNPDDAWYEMRYVAKLPAGFGTIYIDCKQVSTGRVLARLRSEETFWSTKLISEFFTRARNPFADGRYEEWRKEHRESAQELARQRQTSFVDEPLVSLVVPVYCTPPAYLREMIDSVIAQTYARWELVIVNASPDDAGVRDALASYTDERIRVLDHPENDGINGNTNFGIAACKGDYVGFLDHDDFIEPDLLFEYVRQINEHDKTDLLYCDEDSFDEESGYKLPLFKPGANLDLLYSNNYVVHLLMVSREIIQKTTRSGNEMNGAQDYDLTLQAFRASSAIVHVPRILYHWRIHELSTNSGNKDAKPYAAQAGRSALSFHFSQRGIDARIEETDVPYVYRVDPVVGGTSVTMLREEVSERKPDVRNALVRDAGAEFVLFAPGDVEHIGSDWRKVMLGYFQRKEVGIVAPQLVGPEGLVAQTGLVLRRDAKVTYLGQGLPLDDAGYIGRFHRPCNITAVSGDCCMIRRKTFLELGGYDTTYETMLYASIDLCLRYQEHGLLAVYTPFASFVTAELPFATLGKPSAGRMHALEHDARLLRERWPGIVGKSDPFFNQNLDETNPYFVLAH